MTVEAIWDIFLLIVDTAAREVIPQCHLGGEPRPPKEEVPINCSICLSGQILQCIAALSGDRDNVGCANRDILERTYSSLLATFHAPELQSALVGTGLTTLPDLPLSLPSITPAWQYFKRSIWKF